MDSSPWQLQDQLVRQMPKLKKKKMNTKTDQNVACSRTKTFHTGSSQNATLGKKKERQKKRQKNIPRVLIARQPEWQGLGTRAMCM